MTTQIDMRADGALPHIVLFPSLGRGIEDFEEIIPQLEAHGYSVVAVEPYGVWEGESLVDADLGTLARHVLAAVPDTVRMVLVGHAFGNWVARMAATLAKDRVDAVVLLAAAKREIPTEIRLSINGSFDPALSEEERLSHLQRAYFAPGHDASVWLSGWNIDLIDGQRAAAARTDRALWWDAGGVMPILDVQAEHDTIAPANLATELSDELGERVTMVTIKDAGHALLPEQPEAVAEAIHGFLERLRRVES